MSALASDLAAGVVLAWLCWPPIDGAVIVAVALARRFRRPRRRPSTRNRPLQPKWRVA